MVKTKLEELNLLDKFLFDETAGNTGSGRIKQIHEAAFVIDSGPNLYDSRQMQMLFVGVKSN